MLYNSIYRGTYCESKGQESYYPHQAQKTQTGIQQRKEDDKDKEKKKT